MENEKAKPQPEKMAGGITPIANLGEQLAREKMFKNVLSGVVVGDKIKLGPGHLIIKTIGKSAIIAKVKAPKGQKLKVDSGFMLQINGGVFEVLNLSGAIKLNFLGLAIEENTKEKGDCKE